MEKPNGIPKKYEEENYVDVSKNVWNYSLLTDEDVRNYQQGTHYSIYKKFGSHSIQVNDLWGIYFACGRPTPLLFLSRAILTIGKRMNMSFIPAGTKAVYGRVSFLHFKLGEAYKYHIIGYHGRETDKGDPLCQFLGKTATHGNYYLGYVL